MLGGASLKSGGGRGMPNTNRTSGFQSIPKSARRLHSRSRGRGAGCYSSGGSHRGRSHPSCEHDRSDVTPESHRSQNSWRSRNSERSRDMPWIGGDHGHAQRLRDTPLWTHPLQQTMSLMAKKTGLVDGEPGRPDTVPGPDSTGTSGPTWSRKFRDLTRKSRWRSGECFPRGT